MLENRGFIPKEQIEQVVQATDIIDLIGGYIQLKPAGKNFMGLCPFHHEKTPSFVVSQIRQNYHCYGCGTHGNAIRFLMEIEHLKFTEAVFFLAEKTGIVIEHRKNLQVKDDRDVNINNCLKEANEFYKKALNEAKADSEIANYLKARQISRESVEIFQLGYAHSDWDRLHQWLTRKSFAPETQDKAGLIKEKTKGGFYDRLRSRLIFPIFDGRGTLLGFAGRVIGDGRPKYLNPPETLFYKKSDIFYGLYESLEVIRKKRQILIVEGYLDVIRMHENGWRETVAACGTALGNGHARYLKSLGLEKVYLLFDGDSAGVSAAEKSARLFIENELDSSIIILPDKLDPDDYFKQYKADDFSQLMNHAMSDFEFLIQLSAQAVKGKGIEYQKTVLNELLDTNNLIKNPIKKEIFTNKISDYFKIDKKTLSRKNTKSFGRSEASGRFNEPRPSFRGTEPFFFDQTSPEVRFLQYLITQVASITRSRQYVSPDDFNNPDLAKLYERFLHLSDEEFMGLSQDAFPELFVEFSSVILSLTQSSNKILTSTFSDEALDKLIYPIKMQKINQALKYGQSNPDKARELALKKQKLRQQFSHLNHRNDLKDTKKT